MKILALLAAVLVFGLSNVCFADGAAKDSAGKVVYHVVSFKYKATATPEQIKEVQAAFGELKTKIPTITSLHWGVNMSPEKHDKGFTDCFVLTFANDKDRDNYLVDPAHKAFGKIAGPVLDDVMVLDFWAKE